MTDVVLTSTRTNNFSEKDICDTVYRSLQALPTIANAKPSSVIIKPNLCYYWDYSTGETTDPRIVSALIDYIRETLGKDTQIVIAEADASAMKTRHAFKMLGYEKLSKIKNVDLVNLSEGKIIKREVSVNGEKFALAVNELLLGSNFVLNVPKLKYHRLVGTTCALKNIYGAIATPNKYIYHSNLSKIIVAINKIVKSNLTLVDGIIALGKYPKKLGVTIASDDALAADFTAAEILGYNPERINYLKLAKREKVGNVNNINLIENETSLSDIKRLFPKKSYLWNKISWQLQLAILKAYARLADDVIPPVLEQ
jgi:uncharacterized protein (DUF362 family)